jgi:hypothetical protein
MDPFARALAAPELGCGCADAKAAAFGRDLLALDPAPWLFAGRDRVEPASDHAERIWRGGVLRRKDPFGRHGKSGCGFTERMLTVVQALGLRHRSVLDYPEQAIAAQRRGESAPRFRRSIKAPGGYEPEWLHEHRSSSRSGTRSLLPRLSY